MDKIRVLIVDDSLIFRHAVSDALKNEPDIAVVGSVRNGVKALEFIAENEVDVISLDLEMPDMDGRETLDRLQAINEERKDKRPIGVLMLSSKTVAGARATIDALERGAFDFIAKPIDGNEADNIALLTRELVPRIRQYMKSGSTGAHRATLARAGVASAKAVTVATSIEVKGIYAGKARAIVIGVSTGGPRALSDMLPLLCEKTSLPIFIVQHMPPTFTASLAESLGRRCTHRIKEGAAGDLVAPRTVYIAPGGQHMLVTLNSLGEPILAINDQPPENGCRPSVDVLFRSASAIYGSELVAVILTGMGNDGTSSLRPLKRAGARIIVQDEETSVVWGMPGSAVETGLVDEVRPLLEIPAAVATAAKH